MTASFRMLPQYLEITTFIYVTGLFAFPLIALLVPSLQRGIIMSAPLMGAFDFRCCKNAAALLSEVTSAGNPYPVTSAHMFF